MRELYDELIARGEAGINDLIGRQEAVNLEFKVKENASTGEPSRGDRQRLGKILSAFSNSAGGLFVWGVLARKDEEEVDRAVEVQSIAGIDRFKSWVQHTCGEILMPRHEGIVVESIPSNLPGSGYIVIYVERSERRPHRSEVTKHYYKRSVDSSFAMEHYDIEDSFKRLVVPTLDMKWNLVHSSTSSGPQGHTVSLAIDLRLLNTSSVSARFPYVLIDDKGGTQPANSAGITGRVDGDAYGWYGGSDFIVHPDMSLPIGHLGFSVGPVRIAQPTFSQIERFLPGTIRYRCGSSNSRPHVGEIKVATSDLFLVMPEILPR
jgi:hypothetical protein